MIVIAASVDHPLVVELDRRDHQPFLEDRPGIARHRTGHLAADVVVVAERLNEGHDAPSANTGTVTQRSGR